MTPFPEDPAEETPEQLDNRKCGFGKWRNLSPIEISELPNLRDREYIIWAYENVERRDRPVFCSAALYKSVGGKFKCALVQRQEKEAAKERQVSHNPMPGNRSSFDDDDVPF